MNITVYVGVKLYPKVVSEICCLVYLLNWKQLFWGINLAILGRSDLEICPESLVFGILPMLLSSNRILV